jgi:hypothetical protein
MIVLFGCLLFMGAAGPGLQHGQAVETFEEMSTPDMLYVRGLVGSVSIEKMQVSVRPPNEKRIVITIDPDTQFEGVKWIGGLEKRQQVKVWYRPGDGEHRAVKIKKMMDLGC